MEEKKDNGKNRLVYTVIIVCLAANFLQLRGMRREVESMRSEISSMHANLSNSAQAIQGEVTRGNEVIRTEIQKSQSLFSEMSADVKLQDGKCVVSVHAVPKEMPENGRTAVALMVDETEYKADLDAGNRAVIMTEAADMIKPVYQIQSDSSVSQEAGETLYMENYFYCDTSSRWDDTQTVLNVQVTPSDAVHLTGNDIGNAEFIVVSTGIKEEFVNNTGGGGSTSASVYVSSSAGYRAAGQGYVPEPVELPQGDVVEARLWNGFAEGTLSFRGDFSEYLDQEDGMVYQIYFVLTTKEGIRFATPADRYLADFCSARDGDRRGTGGGRLEFIKDEMGKGGI